MDKIEYADKRGGSGFIDWAKQYIRIKRLCGDVHAQSQPATQGNK